MLNYLALLLTSDLLNGPWKDSNPLNVVAQTPVIAEGARLLPIFADERLHWGLPLALLPWMVYLAKPAAGLRVIPPEASGTAALAPES